MKLKLTDKIELLVNLQEQIIEKDQIIDNLKSELHNTIQSAA